MNADTRIIRGDNWALCLQTALATPPFETASWMQQHTELLKSDYGSRVGLLRLQQELCCLKFYPGKSAAQRCLFRLGRGRAVHSFDAAARLTAAQLPVPQPRACLLVPEGMLLLTRGIPEAIDVQALWQSSLAEDQARRMLISAGTLLARLHRAGFVHGDCKWRNLLWSGAQLWLVDLDAVRKAHSGSPKQARDLARFTLNAEELGVSAGSYELFFESYLSGVGESREQVISRMLPALRKLRARHLARYGERGQRLL